MPKVEKKNNQEQIQDKKTNVVKKSTYSKKKKS